MAIGADIWPAGLLMPVLPVTEHIPGVVTVRRLRCMLMSDGVAEHVQDEVWRRLVRLARAAGADWNRVCVALAGPGLARSARELSGGWLGQPSLGREDIEAELIVGFLERIETLDVDDVSQRRVCGRLIDAGVRRARHALRQGGAEFLHDVDCPDEAAIGQDSAGHPEVVLWRAVRAGVLGPEEGELIARTRLEGSSLAAEAARQGVGSRTASMRRTRAEKVLVAALRNGSI